jgi:hypothetical protein
MRLLIILKGYTVMRHLISITLFQVNITMPLTIVIKGTVVLFIVGKRRTENCYSDIQYKGFD